jgi:multiple sugar transport system permease protein
MALEAKKFSAAPPAHSSSFLSRQMRNMLATGTLTLFAVLICMAYLMPMAYSFSTSLRTRVAETGAPLWPAKPVSFAHEGKEYEVYYLPTEQGVKQVAIIKKGREQSTLIDLTNPSQPFEWKGRWRTLERAWTFSPHWGNFSEAWDTSIPKFGRLFLNTLFIALIGTVGTVISCTLVAYGFSRFRIPGKQILFLILIGTIILPPQVTQIPTFVLFKQLGWTNTWLPLLVPHFFANAYNVFLLRQFFMGIPREMDEAAMIDGANPFRTLISVIVPQSLPAIVAVSLFHFFWAWNDFFGPLIYLTGARSLWPITLGMQTFNALYGQRPELLQAMAVLALALPLGLFLIAQRVFMRGVVITGVEK